MPKNDTRTRKKQLSVKQLAAVSALLEGGTMEAAATQVGVSRASLYRWRELPAFRAELELGARSAFNAAVSKLKLSSSRAAATLNDLLASGDEGVRARVAREILMLALRSIETDEIERRLGELEKHLAVARPGTPGSVRLGAYEVSSEFLPKLNKGKKRGARRSENIS